MEVEMTVTVQTPATEDKFTTLVRTKRELAIDDSSTADDLFLIDLIAEASAEIESFCNRRFPKEVIVEKLGSAGLPTLALSRTPVLEVDQVLFDCTTLGSTQFNIQDANAGILYKETRWQDTSFVTWNIEPYESGNRAELWEVHYKAGYVMPSTGSTEARTLPRDLERACLEIVKSRYYARGRDPAIKAQFIEEAREYLFDNLGDGNLPGTAEKILVKYQRLF
jgi:hypothetical protein